MPTQKRFWVRRVVQVIAVVNLIAISAGMIYGLRWPWIASAFLWLALFSMQHFFKADLKIEPAPMNTKILDI